jgi:hypothetical protein
VAYSRKMVCMRHPIPKNLDQELIVPGHNMHETSFAARPGGDIADISYLCECGWALTVAKPDQFQYQQTYTTAMGHLAEQRLSHFPAAAKLA